jgi:transcriptional regulator with XRE-family HTH domain
MVQIDYPEEVTFRLDEYGERVRTSRVRRRWSKTDLAERIGVERRTVTRLEQGEPGVGMGVFLAALWVLGLWDTTGGLANPEADKVGAFLEKQRQPQRVRRQQEKELDF